MQKAKDLYPDYATEEGSFYGPSDYQPIIESLGTVLIQVDDRDYQGDTRVLYKDGLKYGYLIFGWGSCSGCDSLQACSTMNDIDAVIDGMRDDIEWFDDLDALKKYFTEKDWELEYCYHSTETKQFIEQVLNYNP